MSVERDSGRFLLTASVVSLVLSFIPFASFLVYPFKLFVTFIHEGGHALMTLATLGHVDGIVINPDTSGITRSVGGATMLISSAGYLTTTFYGALLLMIGRTSKLARAGLALSSGGILLLTLVFVHGMFGWIVGILLAAFLVFFAALMSARIAHFFLSFLAVQCCLNALYDLRTLFVISATSGEPSDAMNMQRLTLVPAVFWAASWLLVSFVMLWWALRSYFKKAKNNYVPF